MVETGFHFAQPIWLWGLLVVPLVLAWLLYSSPFRQHGQEAKYADPELLPYLSSMATTTRVVFRQCKSVLSAGECSACRKRLSGFFSSGMIFPRTR